MNRRNLIAGLCALPIWSHVVAASTPKIVVSKTPTCGCCGAWVKHLEQAGFATEVHNLDNLNAVKQRVGVPYGLGSCHTAEIEGYFIEGHVPADDIKRLLREKPDAKGLVVPGMPAGSPGMEVPSGQIDRYEVMLVGKDGQPSVFATHGG